MVPFGSDNMACGDLEVRPFAWVEEGGQWCACWGEGRRGCACWEEGRWGLMD